MNKKEDSTERNNSLDLLRIFLAFMVIVLHVNANGTGKAISTATLTPWKQLVGGVTILCYPAVNVYVIISGYFLYKKHKDLVSELKAIVSLWESLLFYSVFGYLIVAYIEKTFSGAELVKRLFPVTRNVWWFYTVYFAIAILSPYIIKLIDSIDQNEFRLLLLIQILICSIFPMFINWKDQIGTGYGYSLVWFFTLFCVGTYIEKYKVLEKFKKWNFFHWMLLFILLSFLIYVLPWPFSKIGLTITFAMYNSIFVLAQAICLFMAFSSIRVRGNFWGRVSAFVAPLSMAAYLLHTQEDIEKVLWEWTKPSQYSNSPKIIAVWIATVFTVFFTSILIEYIRRLIAKKLGIGLLLVGILQNAVTGKRM